MSQPPTQSEIVPVSGKPAFRMHAEQIAGQLARSSGAQACYLSLFGIPGQRTLLIGTDPRLPPHSHVELGPLLRRARGRINPLHADLNGLPALLLPLLAEDRQIGTALLIFQDERQHDEPAALASATLVATALDALRSVASLQLRVQEIEERTRVREIQISRNLIRGIIDSIPLGLALLDRESTILAANRALSERFGMDPAALVGNAYSSVLGRWEEAPASRTFESRAAERVRRSLSSPDGATLLLEVTSFPLLDAEGWPHQVVEVWEDITQRVALQTQLVRAEKLAAIGQLAASIAHEVGNPLQAIQGFLSLFLEQCPPETSNRHFLELAEGEIERIVQVIARLRDLYRPSSDIVAAVHINELLDHVLLLTSKQLERTRVRVLRELEPDQPQVQGVAHQLKQVLLNLVLNAIEAMPNGGVLHVQTSRHHTGGHSMVDIAITDTGVGIPLEQLPYIFDGLHTSKERGMGLGLYTSKAIIEQHMGRLNVQSTVGEGTTFTIILPLGYQEERR